MTTINQVAKKVIADSIDMEYVKDCGHKTVGAVYQAEYGHAGLSPVTCKDYLQGLPSVCTVPFYNNEILALLEKNGITRRTEEGRYNLIEIYWYACGDQLFKLIQSGK